MTANGFMVFQGSRHLPYASSDFIALDAASNMVGPSNGPAITLQTNLRAAPLRSPSVGAVRPLGPTAASARADRPPS